MCKNKREMYVRERLLLCVRHVHKVPVIIDVRERLLYVRYVHKNAREIAYASALVAYAVQHATPFRKLLF